MFCGYLQFGLRKTVEMSEIEQLNLGFHLYLIIIIPKLKYVLIKP